MRNWKIVLSLAAVGIAGCSDGGGLLDFAEAGLPGDGTDAGPGGRPSGYPCEVEERRCVDGMLRTCLDDQTGWLAERCPAGTICQVDRCESVVCEPGMRQCDDLGRVQRCLADGSDWGPAEACTEGRSCVDGVCLARTCTPGERACADKVALACEADGLRWSRAPCDAGQICVDGACTSAPPGTTSCPAGEVLCGPEGIFACNEDGTGWVETPCAAGEACFEGACVECVRDTGCEDEQVCVEGRCAPAPLSILTEALPPAQIEVDYAAQIEARYGEPPYTWALTEGAWPAGLELNADGWLAGVPEEGGIFEATVEVRDAADTTDTRAFRLEVHGEGLVITTGSPLRGAEEGTEYTVDFEAIGGLPPYGWFIVNGAPPEGLELRADGHLSGVPSEIGDFGFRMRVVDAASPPAFAEKDFALTVEVAPLEIIADQIFDLFIAQIVVLPTITVIRDIPIPYDAQLQARGGLRPYHWAEQDVPDAVQRFVPESGIPEGLVLEDDGRLHGAVVDPDQIVELVIPLTQIRLTGFFFFAEVTDSQAVADRDQAIFLLPTLPIGN